MFQDLFTSEPCYKIMQGPLGSAGKQARFHLQKQLQQSDASKIFQPNSSFLVVCYLYFFYTILRYVNFKTSLILNKFLSDRTRIFLQYFVRALVFITFFRFDCAGDSSVVFFGFFIFLVCGAGGGGPYHRPRQQILECQVLN